MTPACDSCGHVLRQDAHFCTSCGTPVGQAPPDPAPSSPGAVPTRRRPVIGTAALAVVAVCGVVAGTIYFVSRPEPTGPSAPAASSRVSDPPPVTARSAAPRVDPAVSPRVALDALVESDRAEAESLVGSWVPQISSKAIGTVVNGRTFDEAAIVAEIEAAKARYPQAVVVRSDDFTSFRRPGFWVTLVAAPSSGPDGVNSWCDASGLGPDDCFAKRLSHSEGPAGNTVPR